MATFSNSLAVPCSPFAGAIHFDHVAAVESSILCNSRRIFISLSLLSVV